MAVKLTGLESSQLVKGSGKMAWPPRICFLRVELITQNVDKAPANAGAGRGAAGGCGRQGVRRWRATRRSSRAPASCTATWAPEERTEVVLLFELPPASLDEGLTLVLPSTTGDVRLALR